MGLNKTGRSGVFSDKIFIFALDNFLFNGNNKSPKKMRRLTLLLYFLTMLSVHGWALTIPAGKFYFDNSLTGYTYIKFVYGSDQRQTCTVVTMQQEEGSLWSVTIPAEVTDMYRYTFAQTTLPDGEQNQNFNTVKDNISNSRNELRTATRSDAIIVGGVFVPSSGDNWAQGAWKTWNAYNGTAYSGTLPVLYINTAEPVTSKETYVSGTYYIDALNLDGYENLGTKEAPLSLLIKGRGNYTWTGFDKKPYRLKFDQKAAPLGMNKSRHFVLLAHADDNLGFLRNTVGFQLSRLIGLAYTPAQEPVEVVLNGNYIGLYFLTENIRIAKDRVNITEQLDQETDADLITGGWLLEINNYAEDQQIQLTEGNGASLWITYHAPEILSEAQKNYLTDLISDVNSAIYASNKNSTAWENYIDLDALVRFYIVQEVMDNAESFHGSCYMHKDLGADSKLIFGPVWDFGNSFHRGYNKFIYVDPPFGQTWIGEIAKYPRFQAKVKEIWRPFFGTEYPTLDNFIDEFAEKISAAAIADQERWPAYGTNNIESKKNEFKNCLAQKTNYLRQQWGEGTTGITTIDNDGQGEDRYDDAIYTIDGRKLDIQFPATNAHLPKGIYIYKGKKIIVR